MTGIIKRSRIDVSLSKKKLHQIAESLDVNLEAMPRKEHQAFAVYYKSEEIGEIQSTTKNFSRVELKEEIEKLL